MACTVQMESEADIWKEHMARISSVWQAARGSGYGAAESSAAPYSGALLLPSAPAGTQGGKGKGKAPPPPPKAAPAKAKAKGGFAPNMKKNESNSKPVIWESLAILGAQDADGHFGRDRVAEKLRQIPTIPATLGDDIAVRLGDLGDAAATAFVLCVVDACAQQVSGKQWSGVEVQTVGTGRGDSEKKHETVELSQEEAAERRESVIGHFVRTYEPACSSDWERAARAWLQSQNWSAEQDAAVAALVHSSFQMEETRSRGRQISEEERKKKEEERRQKDEDQRLEETRRVDYWKSLSSRRVDIVPWELTSKTMHCTGGSGGATMVQIGESEAVVLKPQGMFAVAEALAVGVAAMVGVRVAQIRVLSQQEEEFTDMLLALGAEPSRKDLNRQFVAVVEFIAGSALQGVGGQKALTEGSSGLVFQELGSLIALDCLLNNTDRIPAIWSNDGNLGNVMVSTDGTVIGIDQQVNAIGDASGKDVYFQKLRDFCRAVRQREVDASQVKRIATSIAESCAVELSSDQCHLILEGAARTFSRVAHDKEVILESLKQLEGQMVLVFGHARLDVGLSRLDHMLEFVRSCVHLIAEAFQKDTTASVAQSFDDIEL
eukprot:TRINITY_DN77714_c0_g1_i1.p1 TRINITY_DN77714_c0_g1~~TRINITY_DN77714_c0_g1_i1.p1  ORF type:complete len:618 (+),score=135.51 TRINITY_DN77714_c0_g1_i1:40-1854(+)